MSMTILYDVHDNLYVNLTNQCSCACTFCLRQTRDHMENSGVLWLDREPTAEEVKQEFAKFDMNKYIGLFIATIINREGFKWNYGRQIRLNNCYNLEIDLPVDDDGKPNFSYMEEYIKSLKFSKAL